MKDVVLHVGRERVRETLKDAKRFIFVCEGGDEEAERVVRESGVPWLILRTAVVFGPRDSLVAPMLKRVRMLPVVPIVNGDEEIQPIWHEDLANILASAVRREDADGQVLDALGPEITTRNELLQRLREITDRAPLRVPIPGRRRPVPRARAKNAAEVFGVSMTPLDHALRVLADALPETTPSSGVGSLLHRRFSADIEGSSFTARALMAHFREHVNGFMPIEFSAEPGAPERLDEGVTMTGHLPLRGHFQVRVKVAEPTRVVLATIEGHPLSGFVEFTTEDLDGGGVRFAIDVRARASNILDWIALKTIGEAAEGANWRTVVERVVEASGGTSDGVREEKETA
jgi:NADH dehydrogenase